MSGYLVLPERPRLYASKLPTQQQLAILRLAAKGHSLIVIGRELGMPKTNVANTLSRLYRKIGATGLPHAVAIGYERGWVGDRVVAVSTVRLSHLLRSISPEALAVARRELGVRTVAVALAAGYARPGRMAP